MEKRKFISVQTKNGGRFCSYGMVVCANGELLNPDHRASIFTNNHVSENERLEIWDEVPEDATALRWEWRHGRHHFTTALRPETATFQMLNTAKRLYRDIISERAADIDWADMCLWRHNPTGAPGWNLEPKPILTDEELCAMVEAANERLAATSGVPYGRPHATLHHLDTGWHICTEGDFGQCELAPLLNSSVESFLQQERDYLCHVMVVQKRQLQREQFVGQYEQYRSKIEEGLGGQLINVGPDGFCVIINGSSKIYSLNDTDRKSVV